MTSHPRPLPLPLTPAHRVARAARVDEIRRLVEDGAYRVPAARVADAVLAFHRREVDR